MEPEKIKFELNKLAVLSEESYLGNLARADLAYIQQLEDTLSGGLPDEK